MRWKAASRRKSASISPDVRNRARPQVSATARCCASRNWTRAKAPPIAGASSRWSITPKPASLRGREDWRDVPLVTIDPPDAKDHDDAVHAQADPDPNNKGGYIVTVAIADVAFYVRPGSALDRDALTRGNSVYFPDRVVPMLPERISNDLCSLVPGEPRGALAVRMGIANDGRNRPHRFHAILIPPPPKLTSPQLP